LHTLGDFSKLAGFPIQFEPCRAHAGDRLPTIFRRLSADTPALRDTVTFVLTFLKGPESVEYRADNSDWIDFKLATIEHKLVVRGGDGEAVTNDPLYPSDHLAGWQTRNAVQLLDNQNRFIT